MHRLLSATSLVCFRVGTAAAKFAEVVTWLEGRLGTLAAEVDQSWEIKDEYNPSF